MTQYINLFVEEFYKPAFSLPYFAAFSTIILPPEISACFPLSRRQRKFKQSWKFLAIAKAEQISWALNECKNNISWSNLFASGVETSFPLEASTLMKMYLATNVYKCSCENILPLPRKIETKRVQLMFE